MTRLTVALVAFALLAAPTVSAAPDGKVIVVDRAGGGDHFDIQPAVDAATQQDTILVKPGSYSGFSVIDKSLSIVSDVGPGSQINGPVFVGSLSGDRDVSFSDFHFRGGFEVRDCAASVLFVDCKFREPGFGTKLGESHGVHQVWACKDVVFVKCVLIGKDGGSFPFTGGFDGAFGEHALFVVDSTVTLYSCTVRGGAGGDSDDGGGLGCPPAYQGDGGDGLSGFASFVFLDDTQPVGGPRGDYTGVCNDQHNKDGEDIRLDPTSTLSIANHPPLHMESAAVARENKTLTLTVEGPVGGRAWLLWSTEPGWRHLGVTLGILHLESSSLQFKFLGKIPPGGVLQVDLTLPSIPMGDDALRLYMEPFVVDGARILGNVRRVLVLDSSF